MIVGDLSTLADELRRQGFDARNLGQLGITIWVGREGFFFSADELRQLLSQLAPRDFGRVLEDHRAGAGL